MGVYDDSGASAYLVHDGEPVRLRRGLLLGQPALLEGGADIVHATDEILRHPIGLVPPSRSRELDQLGPLHPCPGAQDALVTVVRKGLSQSL